MLRSGLIALVLMLPVPAFSADASAPVREILAAATSNWQDLASENEAPPAYIDYFSDDFLKRLYSRDFATKYREAANFRPMTTTARRLPMTRSSAARMAAR